MGRQKLSNSQFTLTNNTIKYLSCLELTAATKLVLIYLTSCYNPKKPTVFPRQITIAEKIGISQRTVVRAINELLKKNYCMKKHRPYKSNAYSFTPDFFYDVHFTDLKEARDINIDYELWREAIFKKYDDTCQSCGKKGGKMHAHHIKEYAKNPEKRYDISNGILLCEDCHKKIHPWMT